MMTIVKIIGVVFIIMGFVLTIKAEWFLEQFGRVEWAEMKLGGGTRTFYKLLGIVFVFLGLTMVFELFGGIVLWIFSPMLPKR